jgi:hypothetical protein
MMNDNEPSFPFTPRKIAPAVTTQVLREGSLPTNFYPDPIFLTHALLMTNRLIGTLIDGGSDTAEARGCDRASTPRRCAICVTPMLELASIALAASMRRP